jgi:uncharacterized membrane protein YcaP (DUF421 family)
MDTIIRTAAIYLFLLLVFRLAGKRSLADTNTFEFVILLIISECTQQALVGNDYSVTTSCLAITTLIGAGLVLGYVKQKSPMMERLLDGLPVVIVKDGQLLRQQMDKLRIDEEDILEAAHSQEGLARLDQVRYAIVERNGQITVIPREA